MASSVILMAAILKSGHIWLFRPYRSRVNRLIMTKWYHSWRVMGGGGGGVHGGLMDYLVLSDLSLSYIFFIGYQ